MNARSIVCCAALMVATAWITTEVVSQEAPKKEEKTPPEMSAQEKEMMEKWGAFMTPGKSHEQLMKKAGKWNLTLNCWMDPNAPPQAMTGTTEMKAVMGGRYLVDHTNGPGDPQMGPFEGMGITGFNNLTKKYESVWCDNMGTGVMYSEGTADATGKVITYTGSTPDPMSGTVKKVRMVSTDVDANTIHFEMFDKGPDGKEFKSMEIHYTRAK